MKRWMVSFPPFAIHLFCFHKIKWKTFDSFIICALPGLHNIIRYVPLYLVAGDNVEKCMHGICVIMRESYIKARIIKIRTNEQCYIEEAIRLASNGISAQLSSHSQTPEGFQMFLHENADGGLVCNHILNALFPLPDSNVVIERINC